MELLNSIDGAIFDMDGTLIDSMQMWADSGDLYLAAHGIEKKKAYDLVKSDSSYNDLTLEFMEYYGINRELIDVKRDFELLVAEKYFYELPLKEGVMELLISLKNKGVKMTVATATNSMLAKVCFRRLGILNYFDAVISTKDIGVNKFKPDIYRMCAAVMDTKPNRTAVFEDALYAATTAKNAGFKVVGIYDACFEDAFDSLKMTSDFVVKDYTSLKLN